MSMKGTGKRLLKQVIGGWDFDDYKPSNWRNPQNSTTKKWSKKLRAILKRETDREINED